MADRLPVLVMKHLKIDNKICILTYSKLTSVIKLSIPTCLSIFRLYSLRMLETPETRTERKKNKERKNEGEREGGRERGRKKGRKKSRNNKRKIFLNKSNLNIHIQKCSHFS